MGVGCIKKTCLLVLKVGSKYRLDVGLGTGHRDAGLGGGGTVCWNGVLRGHFLGIRMQHWKKCLSSLL